MASIRSGIEEVRYKMKPSKAIDGLKNLRLFMELEDKQNEIKFAEDNYEAIALAEKALEKQIPKKPIFDYNLSDTLSKFHCECGNTIKVNHDVGIMDGNDAPNYCSDCGQKLDWSEESEENNEID